MNCPICKSDNTREIYQVADDRHQSSDEMFEVWQCRVCEIGFTLLNGQAYDPEKYYVEGYGSHTNKKTLKYHRHHFERWVPGTASSRYSWISKIDFNKVHSLLDVGCGSGKLYGLYKTFCEEIWGIEPNPQAAKTAKDKGMNVFNGSVEDFQPDQKFDLILLIHVLEHLPSPKTNIKKLVQYLSPGGQIVIALPNLDSLERKWYGSHWDGWDIPRHLFHYSAKSLFSLLEGEGMQAVHCLYEVYTVSNRSIRNMNLAGKRSLPMVPGFLTGLLGKFLALTRSSSAIQVIFKKTN